MTNTTDITTAPSAQVIASRSVSTNTGMSVNINVNEADMANLFLINQEEKIDEALSSYDQTKRQLSGELNKASAELSESNRAFGASLITDKVLRVLDFIAAEELLPPRCVEDLREDAQTLGKLIQVNYEGDAVTARATLLYELNIKRTETNPAAGPLVSKFNDLMGRIAQLDEKIATLRAERSRLPQAERKLRAQFTKHRLSQSEDGQEALNVLNGVKLISDKAQALLLTDGSKD